MGNTVYAEGMGFFHKASGGKGVAPGDVCLTPPPPPAGPLPIPYVNMLSAGDLAKGSKTVKIQGEPTALENASEISTSTGNEPATQGGGVVTHKTKGKGVFTLWSFVVKAEGKGVARHGDALMQNGASPPPNCVAPGAIESFKLVAPQGKGDCPPGRPYSQACRPSRKAAQRDAVNGRPCWECKRDSTKKIEPSYYSDSRKKMQWTVVDKKWKKTEYMTHDHQPPLMLAWYLGGCWMEKSPDAFKEHFSKPETVKPHCQAHASSQGGTIQAYVNNM